MTSADDPQDPLVQLHTFNVRVQYGYVLLPYATNS